MSNYEFINQKREHLHTLGGSPLLGTSTVVGIISKPLTWWAAELAAVSALEQSERYPDIRKEYEAAAASPNKKLAIDALQKKYPAFKNARFAHYDEMGKKADKGTDLHAELEVFVKERTGEAPARLFDTYPEQVKKFIKWTDENVDKFILSEKHCYSSRLWVGGIVDCAALLKDGRKVIIDFKSSKDAFYAQFVQTALYDIQISENGVLDEKGRKLVEPFAADAYIIIPFGASEFKVCERKNVAEFRQYAEAAVTLYKGQNFFEQ